MIEATKKGCLMTEFLAVLCLLQIPVHFCAWVKYCEVRNRLKFIAEEMVMLPAEWFEKEDPIAYPEGLEDGEEEKSS